MGAKKDIRKILEYFYKYVNSNDIIGLGMNWTDNYLYFDYALGVINNDEVLDKLKKLIFQILDLMWNILI